MPKNQLETKVPDHKIAELNRKAVIESYLAEKQEEEIQEEKSFHEITVETAMKEILSTENLDMKTDLNNAMILEMSRADVILGVFDLPALKTFTDGIKVYSVSKDRKSRGEIVQLANSGNSMGEPVDPSSRFSKILDRLG